MTVELQTGQVEHATADVVMALFTKRVINFIHWLAAGENRLWVFTNLFNTRYDFINIALSCVRLILPIIHITCLTLRILLVCGLSKGAWAIPFIPSLFLHNLAGHELINFLSFISIKLMLVYCCSTEGEEGGCLPDFNYC